MSKAADLHNQLVGPIVMSIVKPVINAGGTPAQILALTESILVGVSMVVIKLGGDERVLELMFEAAKLRLAELRLKDIETRGSS